MVKLYITTMHVMFYFDLFLHTVEHFMYIYIIKMSQIKSMIQILTYTSFVPSSSCTNHARLSYDAANNGISISQ